MELIYLTQCFICGMIVKYRAISSVVRHMKINIQKPFSDIYKKAYLVINKENRKTVILYTSHKHRSSVSYARYLMSIKLNRFLDKNEHVDHIDNDKTNDNISNLQILTPKENTNKQFGVGQTFLDFKCPECNKLFKLSKNRCYGKKAPTCSRSCGGKKSRKTYLIDKK